MRPKHQTAAAAPAPEPETDLGQKVREMFGGPASGTTHPPTECFVLRNMFNPQR